MVDQSNTPALAGTADLYADEPNLSDLSDAELGLDDELEEGPASPPAEGEPPAEEGEVPETEEAEADAPDEDEEKPEAKDPDDGVKVKLDDGQEVPLGELKKGYLRQADYTRKTQDVARERTEVASAADRLITFDKTTRAALQMAAQLIQDYTPKAPDTSLLNTGRQEDVASFLAQKELFERGQSRLQQVSQAMQQQGQGAAQMSDADRSALVAREMNALIEKRPELRDPKKRQAVLGDITNMAQSEYGFSPEDLAGVTDHRAINVLADAIAYRKLKSQRSAAISTVKATAPMRPATRQQPGQRVQAGQAQAIARARRLGTDEAVAATFTDADLGL